MKMSRYLECIAAAPALLGIALLRFYQHVLSPLKPRTCRFTPSCSEYAVHALRHRGLVVGSAFAVWRVLRCHPWSPGGYDPGPWAQDKPEGMAK